MAAKPEASTLVLISGHLFGGWTPEPAAPFEKGGENESE